MHINGVLKCIVWTNKVRTFLMIDNQCVWVREPLCHNRIWSFFEEDKKRRITLIFINKSYTLQ